MASRLFTPRRGAALEQRASHTVVFGDVSVTPGEVLDEVLVTIMRAPHTYTGEDVVEISCHASPYITQQLLLALLDLGARQADPGEFTMLELARKVIELTDSKSRIIFQPLPQDDPRQRKPDISLAHKELDGWQHTIKLDEGLRHTIEYFKKLV